jgi:hypothetical protein
VSTPNTPEGRAAAHAQYDALALLARSAAGGEQLENVRLKHLTSAVSWEQLAANGRKMEALRAQREQESRASLSCRLP